MVHLHPLDRQRLQLGAEWLHRSSPRVTAELFAEIADRIGGMPMILTVLAEYEQQLTPAMLRCARANRFLPRHLNEVAA